VCGPSEKQLVVGVVGVFGVGVSWGALTVVNALVTGRGAAIGVRLRTRVEVSSEAKEGWVNIRASGSAGDLLGAVYNEFLRKTKVQAFDIRALITTDLPGGMGMKSSSSVANALILALADAYNLTMSHMDVLSINTSASIRAGVSYTGALDDAAACLLGGVTVTDNRLGLILRRYSAKPEKAIFLIPRGLHRPDVTKKLSSDMRCSLVTAHRLALIGRYHEALNINGAVYAYAYGYPNQPTLEAWRLGASAAGITGNGPAYAALAENGVLEELTKKWSAHGKLIITETRNSEEDSNHGSSV